MNKATDEQTLLDDRCISDPYVCKRTESAVMTLIDSQEKQYQYGYLALKKNFDQSPSKLDISDEYTVKPIIVTNQFKS